MYIHIGNGMMIRDRDIIGIFDIENSTVSKDTREYLALAGKRKAAVDVSTEMPRSFITAVSVGDGKEKVYISPIASSTIAGRAGKR